MSRDYEKMYDQFMDYEKALHEKNQRKIRIGIKVNIFLPLVFLLLSFLVPSTRFMFLILWILSLFGIAFYLIYVEYTDYKMQKKLMELGALDSIEQDDLIGMDMVDDAEKAIDETIAQLIKEKDRLEQESKKVKQELADKIKRGDK